MGSALLVGGVRVLELLRIAAVLVVCAAASYTDIKTGLIYDRITMPAILLGLFLNLFEFFADMETLANALLIAAAVFLAGYGFYYIGKIGGGDVKMFVALSLLLPFMGGTVFILQAVFYAVVVASVVLACYYVSRYVLSGVEWKENLAGIVRASVLGIAVVFYIAVLLTFGFLHTGYFWAWLAPVFFGLVFIAFEQGIRKRFFLKEVALGEVEEDDVLAIEFMDAKSRKKIGLGLRTVLGKKEVEKLNESGVKKVKVYRDLPKFAPFVLIGCAIAIAFPELFMKMFLP